MECADCGDDFYHVPGVTLHSSKICEHKFCAGCVDKNFVDQGVVKCPQCGAGISADDLTDRDPDARWLEKQVSKRREVLQIYNKNRDDFDTQLEFDNYLEEREDLINELENAEDPAPIWKKIRMQQTNDQTAILHRQNVANNNVAHRLKHIIEEEGSFFARVNLPYSKRLKEDVDHALRDQLDEALMMTGAHFADGGMSMANHRGPQPSSKQPPRPDTIPYLRSVAGGAHRTIGAEKAISCLFDELDLDSPDWFDDWRKKQQPVRIYDKK